ncbi:hypothetical protein BJV78DRAFT_1194783 [Lactifluus subvellereus]|nr:hypothetical protein BJV78DRAFT_1194783 [Lactifluus subvellereus]
MALGLSILTDLIITASLRYYLRTLHPGLYRTKKMLSTIVSFADNNGALTCIVTLACLTCWIVMPTNQIYLCFHFIIGKCYSNSFLATLNMRGYLKRTAANRADIRSPGPLSPPLSPVTAQVPPYWLETDRRGDTPPIIGGTEGAGPLKISIETTVHCDQQGQ